MIKLLKCIINNKSTIKHLQLTECFHEIVIVTYIIIDAIIHVINKCETLVFIITNE